jgi:hypothetical protein
MKVTIRLLIFYEFVIFNVDPITSRTRYGNIISVNFSVLLLVDKCLIISYYRHHYHHNGLDSTIWTLTFLGFPDKSFL